jgi:hypothetical protein
MNALLIPAEELNLRVNTVDQAVSRANRGDVAGGHDESLHGLQRAEAARDVGGERDEADDAGGRRLQQMFHVEPVRHAAPAPGVPTHTVLA